MQSPRPHLVCVHSSADPARHVPAAHLSIHALVDREHDSLALRPPRIICYIVVNVRRIRIAGSPHSSRGSYAAAFRTYRRPMVP
jgi:hypothetical protein